MYMDTTISVALFTLAILWLVLYSSRGRISARTRVLVVAILLVATSLCITLALKAIPISAFDMF